MDGNTIRKFLLLLIDPIYFSSMVLATVFDARYKLDFFEEPDLRNYAKKLLMSEAENIAKEKYGTTIESESTLPPSNIVVHDVATPALSLLEKFRKKITDQVESSDLNEQRTSQVDPIKKAEIVSLKN